MKNDKIKWIIIGVIVIMVFSMQKEKQNIDDLQVISVSKAVMPVQSGIQKETKYVPTILFATNADYNCDSCSCSTSYTYCTLKPQYPSDAPEFDEWCNDKCGSGDEIGTECSSGYIYVGDGKCCPESSPIYSNGACCPSDLPYNLGGYCFSTPQTPPTGSGPDGCPLSYCSLTSYPDLGVAGGVVYDPIGQDLSYNCWNKFGESPTGGYLTAPPTACCYTRSTKGTTGSASGGAFADILGLNCISDDNQRNACTQNGDIATCYHRRRDECSLGQIQCIDNINYKFCEKQGGIIMGVNIPEYYVWNNIIQFCPGNTVCNVDKCEIPADCTGLESNAISLIQQWASNPIADNRNNAINAIAQWVSSC